MADIPDKLGKYEILGVAGRGNMGTVYIAHDPFVDRKVAIKVCSTRGSADEEAGPLFKKRFFREAQTAGALDHQNILKVYDAGEVDGEPYIVIEYVQGADTLKSYSGADNLLPIETVVGIIQQCAKALDYAHRRGVTHRDIKPANILLTEDGQPKIGDFGIAQRAHSDETQELRVVGTPRYMSPEQARGDVVTNQADLYSLGVVMYVLLTGQPPYQAQGLPDLIYKILNEDPQPLRTVRPDVPETLATIVARAMEKDLDKRYCEGSEIVSDLAAIFAHSEQPAAELSEEEQFEIVRKLGFFNDFSDSELEEVLHASAWERYPAGKEIIKQGELEQAVFIVVSGDVAVNVGPKTIESLSSGDCVGEMGYLSKAKRTASVITLSDVSALKIDSALLEWASIPCQLRFNKVFTKTFIERLGRTSERLAAYI